jgi:PilZ domain
MPSTSGAPYRFSDVMVDGSAHAERRRRPRVEVRWPVLFRDAPGAVVSTATENLSSDGFYCRTAMAFVPGDIRVCTLSTPGYHDDDVNGVIHVECRVRVVRVQTLSECGLFGMGCRIEDYHVQLPAEGGAAHRLDPFKM